MSNKLNTSAGGPDTDSDGIGYPKGFRPPVPHDYNRTVPDTRNGESGKCGATNQIVKNPAGSVRPITIPISGSAFLAEQIYAVAGYPSLLPNLNTEEWDISFDDTPGPIRLSSSYNEIMSLTGDVSGENFSGSQTFYKRGWLYVSGVTFGKLVVTPILGVESYLRVTAFERPIGVMKG